MGLISNDQIKAGNVIVGLCSYGKASYETEYNGGMGSNGLTSARHDVFNKQLGKKFPESYDAALPESVVYTGGLNLTDKIVSFIASNAFVNFDQNHLLCFYFVTKFYPWKTNLN